MGATSVHGDADINETSMMNVYITRTHCLNLPVGALLTVFWPEATQLRKAMVLEHSRAAATTPHFLYYIPQKVFQRPRQMELPFMGLLGNVKILDLTMEALCPCISTKCKDQKNMM